MEIKRSRSDFRALSRVVKQVSLENLYLMKCSAARTPDAASLEKVFLRLDFSSELFSADERNNKFAARSYMKVEGLPDEDDDNAVVTIEAEYIVNYKIVKNKGVIDRSDIEKFCSMNAIYNAWPFFRELILNMTSRMDLPPFTLPLLKIRPKAKSKKQDGRQSKKNTGSKDPHR